MTPSVSVVVVSRGRPLLLKRCVLGLSQLSYPAFEVVVVSDAEGLRALTGSKAKTLLFDEANISAARNLGIGTAAGEIIAFIDDDAVPEPTWLDHLCAPFAKADTACVGGYVRGRNGIAYQWRARVVNETGFAREVPAEGDAPFTPDTGAGEAVKTEGTNFAVRADVLRALGGFDPAFRFFLDETDLNMRLAKAGHRTVIAPLAEVHHGYAASGLRGSDRAPKDLFEIGASSAVFLRKYARVDTHHEALNSFEKEQRKRLLGHMVNGGVEPRDVARILASLRRGIDAGTAREIAPLAPLPHGERPFEPFAHQPTGNAVFAGRPWQRKRLARQAKAARKEGKVVSVYRFSPTALPHWRRFTLEGIWEQRGGLFGPSSRKERPFRWHRFAQRLHKEAASVAKMRTIRANDRNEP